MMNNKVFTYPMSEVYRVFEEVLPELEWDCTYTLKDWMDYARPGFWDSLSDTEKDAIEEAFECYVRLGGTLDICLYKEDEYPPRYI